MWFVIKVVAVWILCAAGVAVLAQDETGAVSSNVTGGGSSASAPSSGAKQLPWKFLAGPSGVLDSTVWDADKAAFDTCDDVKNCAFSLDKVRDLISKTIGSVNKGRPTYVIIHLVRYGDSISDGWYLYRSAQGQWGEPKWTYERFTGQRIYGSRTVYFLFVHSNANAITWDGNKGARAQLKEEYPDMTEEQMKEGVTSGALTITDGSPKTLPVCDDTGYGLKWFSAKDSKDPNIGVPQSYVNVHYEAAVVRRTPANVDDLKKLLGILVGAQGAKSCIALKPNSTATIWGSGRIDGIGPPSDITIAGYSKAVGSPLSDNERAKLQIGMSQSYNDEQLYWWDVSIGIPVHKIKDLQYSDSNNTVTAAQVSKQSAYAMFDLMLHPVDPSDPHYNIWPRLLVGFPLASSPWDKLFAGGAIGLPWKPFQGFQFFAGSTFLTGSKPKTLTAGSSANPAQLQNDLTTKTTAKFTFGINVPIKSVIDKLK